MQDSIRKDELFRELSTVLNPVGLLVVDVRRDEHRDTTHVVVIITNESHDVGIDECAKAHRIIFPRLGVLQGDRHLDLEVSTPGIQRNLHDVYEFSLFRGKRCRIYDGREGFWIEGIIDVVTDEEVVLSQARIEDAKETMETYHIPYGHVQKAKLAYAWEDM